MYSQNNEISKNINNDIYIDFKMFLLVICTILLSIFQIINNSIIMSIICFILIWFASLKSIKFDLLHPYVWFVPAFTLYSITYPIYLIINDNINYFDINTLRLQWLALSLFIIVVGNKTMEYDISGFSFINISIISKILLFTCGIISILYTITIIKSGITSKVEVVSSSNPILFFGNMFVNITPVPLSYIILSSQVARNKKYSLFFLFLFIQLFVFAANGQRAIVISYLIFGAMVYNLIEKKINMKKFIILLIVGLIGITILAEFKMIFTKDRYLASELSFLNRLLSSEFQAGSQNLNFLLKVEDTWQYKYGSTLIHDFLSPINFLLPFDTSKYSAIYWYQNTYFPYSTTGQGFTLVGEGLINFGILGVALWYTFLGLFVKYLYRKSKNNRDWLIIYLLLISLSMYTNRADLANIFSPLLKYGVMPLFLFSLTKKNYNTKENE